MGDSVLDDVARALAEPVPRGRALRMLGAVLVAAAFPGLRPHAAVARPRATCDYGCGSDVRGCPKLVQGAPGPPLCCGSPARRYKCEGTWFEPVCVDTCDGPRDDPCRGPKDEEGCSIFHCCKGPSRCMNGNCSESCKVETGIDTGKLLQYDPKTQCCTPWGPRSKTEGSARECAQTRRKRPRYKPSANGCGTKSDKFPDEFRLSVKVGSKTREATVSFRDACDKHDLCYGTCGNEQDACDRKFCDRLKATCQDTFPVSKKASKAKNARNGKLRQQCLGVADKYCVGPQLIGAGAYWNAQSEACLCC